MIFKQIPVGPMQNFSYIIGDETTKDAAVVDAGWEVDKLIDIAGGFSAIAKTNAPLTEVSACSK